MDVPDFPDQVFGSGLVQIRDPQGLDVSVEQQEFCLAAALDTRTDDTGRVHRCRRQAGYCQAAHRTGTFCRQRRPVQDGQGPAGMAVSQDHHAVHHGKTGFNSSRKYGHQFGGHIPVTETGHEQQGVFLVGHLDPVRHMAGFGLLQNICLLHRRLNDFKRDPVNGFLIEIPHYHVIDSSIEIPSARAGHFEYPA